MRHESRRRRRQADGSPEAEAAGRASSRRPAGGGHPRLTNGGEKGMLPCEICSRHRWRRKRAIINGKTLMICEECHQKALKGELEPAYPEAR